jgi:hypothetical protein
MIKYNKSISKYIFTYTAYENGKNEFEVKENENEVYKKYNNDNINGYVDFENACYTTLEHFQKIDSEFEKYNKLNNKGVVVENNGYLVFSNRLKDYQKKETFLKIVNKYKNCYIGVYND